MGSQALLETKVHLHQSCIFTPAALHRRRPLRTICTASLERDEGHQQRRGIVLGLASCAIAAQAKAGFGWDGTSSAIGSCALGEEGDDCRVQTLKREKLKDTAAYGDIVKEAGRPQQNSVGMPVAVMDDDYSRETLALSEEIELYAGMDLYSSDRPKIVQLLRKDGSAWVSKYARGGSARKLSARRFYIAVDALQGHLASNGFSPFPKNKIPVLLNNVKQARDLIAQGK